MNVSISGWPVLTAGDKRLTVGTVPDTRIKLRAQRDVLPLLLALASDYHRHVAPLRAGECGAWAYRTARQAPVWSDHAAGVAVDLNWGHEGAPGPKGGMVTMSADQVRACAQLARLYRVILWGGDAARGGAYHDPASWDPMHFALRPGVTLAQVRAVVQALRIRPDGRRVTRRD